MNLQETGQLLMLIQVVDNRRIDESVILTWHELLDDVELDVAREAVRMHRRESAAWLMPAHLLANVERILHADPAPEDEYGNRLELDEGALAARARIEGGRRAVTS
ncbi:hypothetical protein [Microbacterium gilvum]|uniref:Uncharacterized protein n=1 Tax=Microbacterium gilvum TaxID=1336204 RepID=A0ABP8ZPQ5_9MICO